MATTEHTGTLKYVDGNGDINVVYPEIKTDSTLSIEGKAADAKAVSDALNTKISNTDVVDNLESTSTYLPLSANQGRLLGKQLGGLTLYAMSETDFTTVEEDTESGLYILYKEEESTE